MRSRLAAIFSLVLPTGRTTGRRIVLDGVNGRIKVFDSNGVLRFEIGFQDNVINWFTGDSAETGPAAIGTSVFGTGPTRRLSLDLFAPNIALASPSIEMFSESANGLLNNLISYGAVRHEFSDSGGGTGSDITLDGKSLPRGRIATGSDNAAGAGANSGTYVDYSANLQATFTAIANRFYRVILFMPRINASVAGLSAGIAIRDGTTVLNEAISNTSLTGALTLIVPTVLYEGTFSAGAHTVKASTRLFSGAGTVTPQPAVTGGVQHCRISVDDIEA